MQIHERYILVIDLEATCCDDRSISRRQMEIIEIGAVILDLRDRRVISEFQRFVRPVRHPQLTPYCHQLTTITQADVDTAPTFPLVLQEMLTWLATQPHPVRFASWGAYDKHQFKQDCAFHRVAYPFSGEHLNLKQVFATTIDPHRSWPLIPALEHLGLSLHGTHHRGIDDARNITAIALKLIETIA
ncbi:MAG: exonuclease domain-containing protein [Coleofasciculaceae cyanobacterium RL_1_1]|nr:exonuclease domain-containing protein [Coleofasciculaceae cyanobacterium RL_1_1]